MRNVVLLFSVIVFSGCSTQRDLVQRRANELAGTVPTLYYEQVLDNVARTTACPETMPYFGIPAQGTHTNSRQLQATYTPGWDFSLVAGWLFDKQTAAFGGTAQNQESFQIQPVSNPDKLLLMQAAYWRATGHYNQDQVAWDLRLRHYFDMQNHGFDYNAYITPGWFCVTKDEHEAKECGCYIASCGDIYVYVPAREMQRFTFFTLAILDIATIDTDYFYGTKAVPQAGKSFPPQPWSPSGTPPPDSIPAPRIRPVPLSPPPIAPTL